MTEVVGRVGAASDAAAPRLRHRLRAPVVVAGARLRAHPGRAILVALGVAAAAALLVAVLGGSLVARDRSVQRSLAGLAASERSFRVDAFGLPDGADYAAADRQVTAALAPLAPAAPLRSTFFRELRVNGRLVQLGGVDGLRQLVRLRSGRLPRICVPSRCEVVEIGSARISRLDEGDIHIVRVGVGDVPRKALFGSSIDTVQQGGDNPALLVASGARAYDRLPAFDGLFRVYSWIASVDPSRIHVWEIDDVLRRETRAQTELARRGDVYQLTGPDQALLDARSQGDVSGERMLLVGGEGSALLLGFALVAALGLRRGLANEGRRLRQRGAGRSQVLLSAATEIVAITLCGSLAGALTGACVVVLTAGSAGLPAGAVLTHSVLTGAGVGVVLAVWIVATLTVLGCARTPEDDARSRNRHVHLLDVAAAGAAVAVGFGLARGGLDASSISSSGSRTLLLGLPILVSFVGAVLAMRLLQPLAQVGERAARKGSTTVRLALLALSRAPTRTTVTAVFLLVSLGLALFAACWRGTLVRGATDEAAFAVPLDFTVTEGPRLVLPLDAGSRSRYGAIAPGVEAYPVLRRNADVAGLGTSVLSPTVLGLEPEALRRLHWRSDFAAAGPDELARRVGAQGPLAPAGAALPARAASAALTVRLRGVAVRLDLVVRDAAGRTRTLPLGEKGPGTWRLQANLPDGARQVVGLQVSLATAEQYGFSHRETGAETTGPEAGSAEIGPLRADVRGTDAVVTHWRGFVPRGGLQTTPAKSSVHLTYAFTEGQTMLLRARQPTDGVPLLVIASPDVARSAGPDRSLLLDFQDVRLPARIVAVADRFPTADDQGEGFVIADERRLSLALDADAPGTGTPAELWIAAPGRANQVVAAALRRPPFDALTVSSRAELEKLLVTDPLARGITLALAAAALVALALAAAGFWVALVSELRDERGELFDLEAQGVSPDRLRRQFRLRAAILVGAGVLGGCVLGVVLSALVVSAVQIAGTTADPEPPLRLDVPWAAVAVGLAAALVVLAAVVELTTRRAFRGDAPERASWSLE